MSDIAIVGTGFIGRAWTITFARAGHRVRLWDQDSAAPGRARDDIAGLLPDLQKNDLLHGRSADEVMALIETRDDLASAVEGVVHVQENTPERLDVKIDVFSRLDTLSPANAVIASSTSALLPSTFTEALVGRHRCLVLHPLNPPYVIPATELVPAPWTDDDAIDRTTALLRGIGQKPIVMKRELDGFVMNRLQGALLEEAFRLVAEGCASIEDIDVGMREGLALRWSFMGPFETIDLNAPGGVADYVTRYQNIYERIWPSTRHRVDWAGPVLEEVMRDRRARLPEAELQARREWRDRRLMALIAHKRQADEDAGI